MFPTQCEDINYEFLIHYLNTYQAKSKARLSELIEKCYIDISPPIQFIIGLANSKIKNVEDLKNYLKIRNMEPDKKKVILKKYDLKYSKKYTNEIQYFIKFVKGQGKKIKKNKLWSFHNRTLEEIDSFSLLIKGLIEGLVAISSQDEVWLKKVILRLSVIHPEIISSELRLDVLNEKETEIFLMSLKKVLKSFKGKIKDKKYFDFMMLNLSSLLKFPKRKINYFDELIPKVSLKEIRTMSSNHFYSKKLYGLWSRELQTRTSSREFDSYNMRILKNNSFKYLKNYEYRYFLHYFPKSKIKRNYISKNILNLKHNNSIVSHFIFSRLLDNEIIKHEIAKINSLYKRPGFLIQRKLAFDNLNKGKLVNYSLYRLFKLGNYNEEILLWMTL